MYIRTYRKVYINSETNIRTIMKSSGIAAEGPFRMIVPQDKQQSGGSEELVL